MTCRLRQITGSIPCRFRPRNLSHFSLKPRSLRLDLSQFAKKCRSVHQDVYESAPVGFGPVDYDSYPKNSPHETGLSSS